MIFYNTAEVLPLPDVLEVFNLVHGPVEHTWTFSLQEYDKFGTVSQDSDPVF